MIFGGYGAGVHLFPFRAEGVGSADNVKLNLTSPMILHPRLNPKSRDSSDLGSQSHRLCSYVEKYVKEVQWIFDSVAENKTPIFF